MKKNSLSFVLFIIFFIFTACNLPGDIFGTSEPEIVSTNTPEVATETSIPPTDMPTSTPDPYAGWSTYINQDFGYQFDYPPGAVVTAVGVSSYPTNDLPAGMTPGDYMTQLQQTYGDQLCVMAGFGLGYVNFSAPINSQKFYTICGRTGVGVGTMTDKTEQILINGNLESAEGFEFYGGSEELDNHNETFVIHLTDETRIEYGAGPDSFSTYADYISGTKDVLLMIVESYRPYP
ncbi:MAG: hypothetical protein HON98_01965 [Chloroflexi bacterium]|jgi:hypothetical protein|nr:hypothetical protein [Chloroflexota bacterium]MBT3670854.1 hypothetical protein [Chloroflexota bacterium]MBT4004322.1 hypothetical protein [Chloroflexota bacterium]MBT4305313.1 hypothetical protein [Chloroflexota bacterium]MBT4532459.1 hypothetical protein [Chloroflexota bacterium]